MYALGVHIAAFFQMSRPAHVLGTLPIIKKDIHLHLAMTGQPHELPQEGQCIPVSQSLLPLSQGFQILQYLQTVIMLSSHTKQTLGTKKTQKTSFKKTENQRLR